MIEKADLKVVIRGVPASSDADEIKEDLINQGIGVISVNRLMSSRMPRNRLALF